MTCEIVIVVVVLFLNGFICRFCLSYYAYIAFQLFVVQIQKTIVFKIKHLSFHNL